MPRTHDTKQFVWHRGPVIVAVESLFYYRMQYPSRRAARARPPLSEKAMPREVEDPFRNGHGRAFRLPLTRKAVVFGYWEPPEQKNILDEEEDAYLLRAVAESGRMFAVPIDELRAWGTEIRPWGLFDRWVMPWLPKRWQELVLQFTAFLAAQRPGEHPSYTSPVVFGPADVGDGLVDVVPPAARTDWPDDELMDLDQARVEQPRRSRQEEAAAAGAEPGDAPIIEILDDDLDYATGRPLHPW